MHKQDSVTKHGNKGMSVQKENKKLFLDFALFLDAAICIFVIFALYLGTLNRPWIFYDERVIYEELAVPIPSSINEIFEIIKNFGITGNITSSNLLYSSNTVHRPSLFGVPFLLILGLVFKKSAILYHFFNLVLHLINTTFVFLILKTIFTNHNLINRLFTILLTLIWSAHPVISESVLLSTNVGANLSYIAFFALFYDFIKNKEKNKTSLKRKIILPFYFLMPMLLNEYIIALPLALFAYSFIKSNVKTALHETFPYITGLFIYLIYFIFSSYRFVNPASFNPLVLFLEKGFWLSPQIFLHFLKLIFLPKVLSIDQTMLVHLGKSLFDLYAIFCIAFLLSWIFIPLILFKLKKISENFLILSWLFYISIIPFSQVLTPTYCLIAERYFYTPLFFIVFGLAHVFSKGASARLAPTAPTILIFLSVLLISGATRTYFRTLDWKNNETLLKTTINSSSGLLHKGLRTKDLSKDALANKYFYKALKELKTEEAKYKNQPLILKSYGLDTESLLVKNVYYLCLNAFEKPNEDVGKYIKMFNPYIKYYELFDPRTIELYANLLIKNNEIEKAKGVFLYAINKYPTSSFLLISLIRFEREIEKDFIKSKEYLTKALKLYPYSRDILLEAAKQFLTENNMQEYAKYSYLCGLRTHSPFYYREALASYLMLKEVSSAKNSAEKLLLIDSDSAITLYLVGSYFIAKNDHKAFSYLKKAYSITKEDKTNLKFLFDITILLANLNFSRGYTSQGIHFAQEALKYANNDPQNLALVKKLLESDYYPLPGFQE